MSRKIIKNNRGSYYINIPKELLKEMRWQEGQKLEFKKSGKTLVLRDWEK